MVPHKTLPEFSSFYNNPPMGVTISSMCLGGGPDATYDFNNFSGTAACPSRSNITVVSDIPNSMLTNKIRKTGLAACTVALKKYETYAVGNVTTSDTNFSVCQNDQLQLGISCGDAGGHSGTIIIESAAGVNIDTVNVNFTSSIVCF